MSEGDQKINAVPVNLNNVRSPDTFHGRLSYFDLLSHPDFTALKKASEDGIKEGNPLPSMVFSDFLRDHGRDDMAEDVLGKVSHWLQDPDELKQKIIDHHNISSQGVFTVEDAAKSSGQVAKKAANVLDGKKGLVFIYSEHAPTKMGFSYSKKPTGIVFYRKSSSGKWGRSAQANYVKSNLFEHS